MRLSISPRRSVLSWGPRAWPIAAVLAGVLAAPPLGAAPQRAEIQPDGTLVPLPPADAASACPAEAGTVLPLRLALSEQQIGPYRVTLPAFAGATARFAPTVIQAAPGESLRIDLVNALPRDPTVLIRPLGEPFPRLTDTGALPLLTTTNLHMHGLIVAARPAQPCLGDYVFSATGPATAQGYRIDIPAQLPGPAIGLPPGMVPYPAGMGWFHAHLHGVARDQVGAGLSGVLSVGDPAAQLGGDATLLAATDIRYLALRDIQLTVPRCAPGEGACDPRRPRLPDRVTEPVPAFWGSLDPALDDAAKRFYDPGACGDHVMRDGVAVPAPGKSAVPAPGKGAVQRGPGWCAVPAPRDPASGTLRDAVWLFTVNGALHPTLTLAPGRHQLWRVANLSASASYVLELEEKLPNGRRVARPLRLLALDGAAVGGRRATAGSALPGQDQPRLLLMPAARAEILLPNTAEDRERRFVLRTRGLFTGNGRKGADGAPVGDTWPATDLAAVRMLPGPVAAAPQPLPVAAAVALAPAATAPSTAPAAVPPECILLPPDTAERRFRRRIVFVQTPDDFRLGSHIVDDTGRIVDAAGRATDAAGRPWSDRHLPPSSIAPRIYPADHHAGGHGFPAGPRICAVQGRPEVWELVNLSDELHNFHMHQVKFRLAQRGDPGAPARLPRPSDAAPGPDAWHDTLPVAPQTLGRRGGSTPGRTLVLIPFAAEQQVGRYVFHCHILEHEDGGMMAAIEVLPAAGAARVVTGHSH